MGALRPSASCLTGKSVLQRRSKALTQMRTWISCHRSLLASWVLYAGSINMTNAVDSLNVENIVEGSRCPTALASHAGIPEPLVLRFEELWWLLASGRVIMPRRVSRGSASRSDLDASRSSLEAPTYARSLLEQIHGASRLPPRPCWDHPQQPWVLRSARGGSSALLPIAIVACCGPRVDLRSCIRLC